MNITSRVMAACRWLSGYSWLPIANMSTLTTFNCQCNEYDKFVLLIITVQLLIIRWKVKYTILLFSLSVQMKVRTLTKSSASWGVWVARALWNTIQRSFTLHTTSTAYIAVKIVSVHYVATIKYKYSTRIVQRSLPNALGSGGLLNKCGQWRGYFGHLTCKSLFKCSN